METLHLKRELKLDSINLDTSRFMITATGDI